MDNKTDDLTARENFLTRKFAFPAWIIIVIAIVLVLLGWVLPEPGGGDTPPESTATQPSTSEPVTSESTWIPTPTILDCTSEESLGSFTCADIEGYTLSLEGVPAGVTPNLLKISAQEEEELRALPTDGIGCVVSIAGNLVFYDGDDSLVTRFDEPVTLTFNYAANDVQFQTLFNGSEELPKLRADLKKSTFDSQLAECAGSLMESGVTEIELVPIYLYAPLTDEVPAIQVWKPFQVFSVDTEARTMTIEFLYWGDRQVGGGTKP